MSDFTGNKASLRAGHYILVHSITCFPSREKSKAEDEFSFCARVWCVCMTMHMCIVRAYAEDKPGHCDLPLSSLLCSLDQAPTEPGEACCFD